MKEDSPLCSFPTTQQSVCIVFFYTFTTALHCFSVAGTHEGPLDDKYRAAESVSGQLRSV